MGGLLGVTESDIALSAVHTILDLRQLFSGDTFHLFRAVLPVVERADWKQLSSTLSRHEFAAIASYELLFRCTLQGIPSNFK